MTARISASTVDCHVHFWDLTVDTYQWVTPRHGVLYRNYLPQDLEISLFQAGVQTTVAIQTTNSLEDTYFMLRLADETEWLGAIVGWIPLEQLNEAEAALDRFGIHPKFRGVRHLLGRTTEDPDWLARSTVLDGLRLLADRGFVFEVQAEFPRHLRHVPLIAEAVPDLTIIIGHLAKPPIRDPQDFDSWAQQLGAAAQYSNVCAKISGMNTLTRVDAWWTEPLTAELVKQYVDHAVTSFNADRLMVGSNWPVSLTAGDSYSKVWREMRKLFQDRPTEDVNAIFGGTATRVFQL